MIDRRLFLGGAAAATLLPAIDASASTRAAADRIVDRFVATQAFAGSISLARAGRITHQRVFGLADRERRLPVTADTTFRIGSVSKWFTALAVLRLVDRGRLSLAAPVRTYLPVLPGPYGAVALEHLLANDSGIPDRVSAAIKSDPGLRNSVAGSAEIVARFADGDLIFRPGERFDYSFFNWVLVHAAIERVTGKPFEQVIRDEVFLPLGLTRSGFVDTRSGEVPGLALAYGADGERKDGRVPPFGGASGNIHATAADLARAAMLAHDGARFLSAHSRAELVRIRVPAEDYALGGRVRRIGGRPVTWETGKVQAYRAHVAHELGRGRTVVILNNGDMDQGTIGALVEELLALA